MQTDTVCAVLNGRDGRINFQTDEGLMQTALVKDAAARPGEMDRVLEAMDTLAGLDFAQDIPAVYEILRKGTEAARAEAAQTLREVRHAMRIDYFDDPVLMSGM